MKKPVLFVITIMSVMMLYAGMSPCQADVYSGGGYVELPTGVRLPGFPVDIYNGSNGGYIATVYTDQNGKWTYSTTYGCFPYFIACILGGPHDEDAVCVWANLICGEFVWFPDIVFPCDPGPKSKKPCPTPGGPYF
jgi:hypothetical protein